MHCVWECCWKLYLQWSLKYAAYWCHLVLKNVKVVAIWCSQQGKPVSQWQISILSDRQECTPHTFVCHISVLSLSLRIALYSPPVSLWTRIVANRPSYSRMDAECRERQIFPSTRPEEGRFEDSERLFWHERAKKAIQKINSPKHPKSLSPVQIYSSVKPTVKESTSLT